MDHNWLFLAQAHVGGTQEFVDQLARTPISRIVIFVAILTALRVGLTYWLNQPDPHRKPRFQKLAAGCSELFDAFIYAGVFVFMLIRPFGVQAFVIPTGSMWPQLRVNDFIVANKAVYRFSDPKRDDIVVFHPPSTAAFPGDLDATGDMKSDFVKRCIGIPGDLVEVKNGILYRNGEKVEKTHDAYSVCMDDPNHCQEYRDLTPEEMKHTTMPSFKLVIFNGRLIPLNYTEADANSPDPEIIAGMRLAYPYSIAKEFQIADPKEQREAVHRPAQRLPSGMYLMMGDNRNNSYDGRAWGLVSRDRIIGRAEFVWLPVSHWHTTR